MLRVNKDDGILYKGPEIRGGSGHGPLTQCALRVEANVFNENVLLFFSPQDVTTVVISISKTWTICILLWCKNKLNFIY